MRTVYLITVRLKSTRLPQKALRPIAGRPVLSHQIDRLRTARRTTDIVLCTSTHPQDDAIEALARTEGVGCYRGDEDDVLVRLSGAARDAGADYILNITGDCPFVDPAYADRIVEAFERTNADLIRAMDLPHGAYSYGIKPSALAAVLDIKADRHTEAWGRYFTDTDLFRVHDLDVDSRHRRPGLRMTLDYPEDLAFVEAVFAALYQPGRTFTLDEILAFLDDHPEVVALNASCGAWYGKRFAAQSTISLKPRYDVSRVAIVGCGSVGQRHVRNLRALGITDIVALRTKLGHTGALDPALDVEEVTSFDALVAAGPQAAIVSNPTSLHKETALALVPHVRGLFIEKPVATSLSDTLELMSVLRDARVVSFVGYNLQFHPAVAALRDACDAIGALLTLQCQVGQYLPDWHAAEDYRQAYFARQALGGGMLRTLSHEIHLANSLLGAARRVSARITPYPDLDVDVDMICDLQVEHSSGAVSHIHLDGVQRVLHRRGVLSGERGWMQYDLVRSLVTGQHVGEAAPAVRWEDPGFDGNAPYLAELDAFLRFTREGRVRHEHDVCHAVTTAALIDASFASARSGSVADVTEVPAS